MSRDWPAWATQPVEIVEPDPSWPDRALRLAADVDRRLAPWLAGGTEHVGSTAVPGLAAKPVLDLMAPVRSLTGAAEADATLAAAGWALVPPELDERPWRRSFVLPDRDRRVAHLHLVERGHAAWTDTLVFRDRLRADTGLAAEYAALKRRVASAHRDDREAYTAAKSAFVARVVTGAGDSTRG